MPTEEKSELTVVYDGITISYDERDDVFRFILRGRNRSANSLRQAKEFIDKPVPESVKKKTFEPTQAYYQGRYSGDFAFEEVTVTSVAEDSRHGISLWIKDANGNRSKEGTYAVFLKNDANAKIIQQIKDITKQINDLEEQRSTLKDSMAKFEVEKEQDED